ncbi:hypothetical protein SO802_024543 [Lithocarpus litseifolius]|uniref:Yippee domain-containing protein n=1 Tax=Lithocarpus litseifolius TaxID=425828 RepID=A0AAW2CCW0_9ROSI
MAELSDQPLFSCRNCQNPLALRSDLLSKNFWGKSGPAYLFSHAMNISVGQKEDRQLMTGLYTIADIYCCNCGENQSLILQSCHRESESDWSDFWVFIISSFELVVGPRLYSCCNCRNHVSLHDDIISKAFQGRNGRAFLFSHAMNIVIGPREDRHLMTGLHTVADIYCADCHEVLGWKYERAYEATQKYKEGKFILEKSKIVKENW